MSAPSAGVVSVTSLRPLRDVEPTLRQTPAPSMQLPPAAEHALFVAAPSALPRAMYRVLAARSVGARSSVSTMKANAATAPMVTPAAKPSFLMYAPHE